MMMCDDVQLQLIVIVIQHNHKLNIYIHAYTTMSDESSEEFFDDDIEDNEIVADESFDTLLIKDKSAEESEDSQAGEIVDDEAFSFHDIRLISNHIKEVIIVRPENRMTSNVMTKYEMTEYIDIRAVQIAEYNNCMADITGLSDPVLMAKRELMQRKCPLMLRRAVGTRTVKGESVAYYEDWNPAEMTFTVAYPEAD